MMFDKSYIISIKRNEERLRETMTHLNDEGIIPEIYHGLDGEITGIETKYLYEVDHPGTGFSIGPKVTNLYLSHFTLWKACLYSNGDTFLIMEDDVRYKPGWREHVDQAVRSMDKDWGMLFVGSCCCENRHKKKIKGRLHEIKYAVCAHSYAVTRKALEYMTNKMDKFWCPVDMAFVFYAIPFLKTYAILPRVADQFNTELAP